MCAQQTADLLGYCDQSEHLLGSYAKAVITSVGILRKPMSQGVPSMKLYQQYAALKTRTLKRTEALEGTILVFQLGPADKLCVMLRMIVGIASSFFNGNANCSALGAHPLQ